MTLTDIIVFTILAVSIIVLYFWLFRQYRIDVFRQRIFAVRDDLFDYAAAGKIAFDHPAYLVLRNLMNGYVRFSHRISLLSVMNILVWTKLFNKEFKMTTFEHVWQQAIQGLDETTLAEIVHFKHRAEMNLFYYLFLSSALKKAVAIPMLAIVIVKFLWNIDLSDAEYEEFRQYAYEDTAERSSPVKHSIEYVNEDAYCVGQGGSVGLGLAYSN